MAESQGSLAEAQSLLKQATSGLLEIRNNTPADYYDDPESMNALQKQVGALGDQVDLAAMMARTNDADVDFADNEVYPVQVLYRSVDSDLVSGRLPRSPEDPQDVPGQDPRFLQMQAMREDAADAEAEPATNGYDQSEEVPDVQSPDDDTDGG